MKDKPICVQKKPYVLDMKPGTYSFCTCGRSEKDPFCDGKHANTYFKPEIVKIEKDQKFYWCGCKDSDKGAKCDGAHRDL